MAGKLLTRLRQLGVKVEGTEGTAETITAAEAKLLVWDPKITPTVEYFKRTPAKSSLGMIAGLPGIKTAQLTFSLEMRGSGTATTVPAWDPLLRACGFQQKSGDMVVATIGSPSGGPFVRGEEVTGGTSSATGRVINRINAAGSMLIEVTSGTFTAGGESLTGGTSSATASASAISAADAGIIYTPLSGATVPSVTLAAHFDGLRHLLVGARGTVNFTAEVGKPMMMEFEFTGVWTSTTDTALLTITHETTVPPQLLDAGSVLDAFSPCFETISLNVQSEVQPRPCANNANGVLSFILTGREPQVGMDPEQTLEADHDFMAKYRGGDQVYTECNLGSSAGNRMKLVAGNIQYVEVSDDERNSLATYGLTCDCVESTIEAEDEVELVLF